MPSVASMDRVKLDFSPSASSTIGGRSSWRQRSSVRVRQTNPRARRAMKLTWSALQCSAATMTTPSLWLSSSSSSSTTIRPWRISLISSSTVFTCIMGFRFTPWGGVVAGFRGSRCRRVGPWSGHWLLGLRPHHPGQAALDTWRSRLPPGLPCYPRDTHRIRFRPWSGG